MRTLLILLLSTVAALSQPVLPSAFWAPAKSQWTIVADSLWNFTTGNNGDLITVAIASNQYHGLAGSWSLTNNPVVGLWASTASPRTFPAPVTVSGTTYSTQPTVTWDKSMTNQFEFVQFNFTDNSKHACSIGGFIAFGMDKSTTQQYDHLGFSGTGSGAATLFCTDGSAPYVAIETSGTQATFKGRHIPITTNYWYWFTMLYTNQGQCAIQLWDPATTNQVGLTTHGEAPYPTNTVDTFRVGRIDSHGSFPSVLSHYGGLVFDTTTHRFPLLPWNITTDTTVPTLAITNPSPNGTTVTGAAQIVQGTASDSGSGVAVVSVSLNDGAYQDASGTTTWSINETFTAGGASNSVAVKVEDNAGNVSSITTNHYKCNDSFTTQDSVTGTTTGGVKLGDVDSDVCLACKFVAGATYTCTKIGLNLSKTGAPNTNMTAAIYSTSSDLPNAQVGTASGTVSTTTVTGSETEIAFTGVSASLTSGTTYWVVLTEAGNTGASDYITWNYVTQNLTGHNITHATTCPPTSTASDFRRAKFTTYSGP